VWVYGLHDIAPTFRGDVQALSSLPALAVSHVTCCSDWRCIIIHVKPCGADIAQIMHHQGFITCNGTNQRLLEGGGGPCSKLQMVQEQLR
jgi:hypothetical protein